MTSGDVSSSRDPQTASTSLLERVRLDENEAWARLLELYGPAVRSWSSRAGLDTQDAEEVAQEVFIAARRAMPRFRRDEPGQSFGGWLRAITINKIIDQRRRAGPRAMGGSDAQHLFASITEDLSSSDMDDPGREIRILHERALALIAGEFSERDNEAFTRIVVDGEAPHDVAEALGVSVNVVYLAKSRILRRLREEFCGLLGE